MVSVKLSKKVPAKAAWSGVLVASDGLGSSGLDKRLLSRMGFKGEAGQTVVVPGTDGAARVLVGVGSRRSLELSSLRKAGAAFARTSIDQRAAVLELGDVASELDPAAAVQAVAEGVQLGGYRYTDLKSKPKAGLGSVTLVGSGERAESEGLRRAQAIGGSVAWARDLVNEPGGSLTPEAFAAKIVERADGLPVEVEVLNLKQIRAAELGGLLAVNQGSTHEPRFVTVRYSPEDATGSLGYVGKGITFDSGGLSIKPAEAMMTMKNDMGGAAAVAGAVMAVAELGLPTAVTAYLPMTDNMTGGDAQRPGDVFTAKNGITVEVLNTDAEGRLILADGLALASDGGHDAIVDVATLTGACMVALGPSIAGLMGSDDELIDDIRDAAERAGERVWPLPLPEDYKQQIESPVADLKNIGSRFGGTLTAGLFLKEFVNDGTPWAHLDIAGPAFSEDASNPEIPKGGTGFGVRTLVALADR